MTLELVPMRIARAREVVRAWHRHHPPPVSGLFAIGCALDGELVGAVIVGRPVARHRDDGWTAEVTRLVTDGTPHVASMLYAAAWRACRAMGYRRLGTYTLTTEPGTSLRAAGWRELARTDTRGRSWDRPGRRRLGPEAQQRIAWEVSV